MTRNRLELACKVADLAYGGTFGSVSVEPFEVGPVFWERVNVPSKDQPYEELRHHQMVEWRSRKRRVDPCGFSGEKSQAFWAASFGSWILPPAVAGQLLCLPRARLRVSISEKL